MKKRKKNKDLTLSRFIAIVLFAVLMTSLIVFTMYYDPSKQYSNTFFEDVSNVIKWNK